MCFEVPRYERSEFYGAKKEPTMFFVYLLRSEPNNRFYIGYTDEVDKRLRVHNSGGNMSTKSGRPWKVIYYEAYLDKRDALGREKFLKSGSGYRYLKKQLKYYLGPDIDDHPTFVDNSSN